MQMKDLKDVESLETSEGLMRPLLFGENLLVFHLEIPAGLKVRPHAHEGEGVLYCLSGELEVTFREGRVNIGAGCSILVSSGEEVGVENKQDRPVEAILIGSPPMVKSLEELKELLKAYKGEKGEK